MKLKCSRQELFLVGLAFVIGAYLRMRHTEQLAVEHFDEGVYSAGLWYSGDDGSAYPMRHLYAPPLVPSLIEMSALLPGLSDVAPFVPGFVFGCLSILVFWWVARSWFGLTAGVFCVFVVALSDYHIQFSRMALTDVPVLFWICAAVGLAGHGLSRSSIRLMAAAGLCTGIAWWTKYTGWLPLAIVWSGGLFWWGTGGRRQVRFTEFLKLVCTMTIVAGLAWMPWLLWLQDSGGYSVVAENHRGYFSGLAAWQDNMASHIMFHFHFDSWIGAAAILLGMLAAGTRRWIELARSSPTGPNAGNGSAADFPAPVVLSRLITAGVVMGVIATGISSFGLLACIAIGGMAGTFLWPTLSDLYGRSQTKDTSPATREGHPFRAADFDAAPWVDPRIGSCLAVAWLAGMLFMTPMYHPFPRLSLTLLASVVLASAGGVAWWIEATFNVARRNEPEPAGAKTGVVRKAVFVMVFVAVALTIASSDGLRAPTFWENRTSLRDAAWHLSQTALLDAAGQFEKSVEDRAVDEHGLIRPGSGNESDAGPLGELFGKVATPFDCSKPLAASNAPECVVYGYGEPAVLRHVRAAGIVAGPVQDLSFPVARTLAGKALPTYLILGPNAIRTPGLLNEWAAAQYRFRHVADFYFAPGTAVLLNLFPPQWIAGHVDSRVQRLELYRLNEG